MLADGFQSYTVIDASGGFSQTQVDMGILRMQQVGFIPVGYSNVSVEILAHNAAPEAEAVYAALGMPFSALVFSLRQYYSQASVTTGKKGRVMKIPSLRWLIHSAHKSAGSGSGDGR